MLKKNNYWESETDLLLTRNQFVTTGESNLLVEHKRGERKQGQEYLQL